MTETTFVVPPEIRRLLGPAPVVSSEDPDRFDELLSHSAQWYRPNNPLEWSRVWQQTVAGWKRQRLERYVNHVHESLHKKVVEPVERARAKQAQEERNLRELDQLLASYELPRRAVRPA